MGCDTLFDFTRNQITCNCDNVHDKFVKLMSVPSDPVELCVAEPTARGCPDFCKANPTDFECLDKCEIDPTARGCPGFCDANPLDPDCGATPCQLDPASFGCPDYCKANPTDPVCGAPPPRCFIDPNDPICQEAISNIQFIQKPNLQRNKNLIWLLSILLVVLIVAACSLCFLMNPRYAKDGANCWQCLPCFTAGAAAEAVSNRSM